MRPPETEIVLLGAGHAHVEVLRRFAQRPQPGVRLTLVAREPETPYSGMLPGVLRGDYRQEEAAIDLAPLAAAAGARLIMAEALALHLESRRVAIAGRPALPFDLLSLDVGGAPAMPEGGGLPVKPIGRFLADWSALEAVLPDGAPVAIVGGGAGGTELALALARRCGGRFRLTLVTAGAEPLAEAPALARRAVRAALVEAGVALVSGVTATHAADGRLSLSDGSFLETAAVLWATGVTGPAFLAASGLACDEAGCVRVDAFLRSVSHGFVFAAGDCAALADNPRPKAGVWAVRAGGPLAENLRRSAAGDTLQRWRPQADALAILGLGGGRAVAWRNGLAVSGAAVWRWKDRIDRRWLRRYTTLRPVASPPPAADSLAEAAPAEVIIKPPLGKLLIQNLEQVPALVDDPFVLGRLAVVHALADLHAAGARPAGAIAYATMPPGNPVWQQADLAALVEGIESALRADGATLLRWDARPGDALAVVLSVDGWGDAGRVRRRAGLQPGDALVLTKKLGAGVVLAGHRQGRSHAAWLQAALDSVQASDEPAARILAACHATACAALKARGLLGTLSDMLMASGAGAALRLDSIPLLPGALQTGTPPDQALAEVLTSPAIGGGLLAGVPAVRISACLDALAAAGVPGSVIGLVEPAVEGAAPIRWEPV